MSKFFGILKESLTALWANRLRSFLTILGMVMGVTSVIAIVSTVEGMQMNMEDSISNLGPRTFMITRFGFTMSMSEYLERLKRKKLTRGLIPIIEDGCPDCDEVGAEGYANDHLKYGAQRLNWVEIQGSTSNMFEIRDLDVMMGRYLSSEDGERRKKVAFIGYEVYEKFFEFEDPLGKTLKVGKQNFTIIGVANKMDGALVRGFDKTVIIPLSTHQKIYQQPGNPVNIVVKSETLAEREVAMDQVRVVLRSARGLGFEEKDDFEIVTPDGLLSFVNDITRGFRVLMVSLPLLSIVIGGIVIMNIMLISVTERTREIGIRKSIGACNKNIMSQFLYESLILSMIGGLLGILFGVSLGQTILSSLMDIYQAPTMLGIFLGFGISTGVGLFFGIFPAMKAAKLNPIKALSYE